MKIHSIYHLNFPKKNTIDLVFKGLDTYADVYLNDSLILKADNMFIEWKIDAKPFLNTQNNKLKIYFHSPIKIDLPKWEKLPYQYPASNDQSENGGIFDRKVSVFARKAGYHYGWDWGPRLVTSGIWRPVFLEGWDNAKIENVFFEQTSVTKKEAKINTQIEILSNTNSTKAEIIKDKESGKIYASKNISLNKGTNTIHLPFNIKNPELWWSNGLGKAHLYQFETTVLLGKQKIDDDVSKIGIRSLKVINKPDKDGESLYFELNGVPVFAKGANYIPSDSFLPRISDEIYRKDIADAVNANMNMLRVWGGGIYAEPIFYELCDENGILVWQDFMFACSMYPADEGFLENVKKEAEYNIKRLRNHPSVAIWCGNNEISEAWFGWGWKQEIEKQNPDFAKLMWKQYEDLFYKLLPEMVSKYDPQKTYRPSSPFSRNEGRAEPNKGDSHYWSVWHGKEPISKYNEYRSRFFSEYGFQSFPEFETVKLYAPEKEDWKITSELMMSHQRGGTFANSLIEDYLSKNYKNPSDFQLFLLANQVLQGDAIKTAIEAHRRDMPYCMGSLFWQHNDSWPVASWSSRDYHGRWKAQHYFAKKAYADILVSPIQKDENLEIFLVSDRLKETKGNLQTIVKKMNGTPIFSTSEKIIVKANTSAVYSSPKISKVLKGNDRNDVFIQTIFIEESGKIYDNIYFLAAPKDLHFQPTNISKTIKTVQGGYEISVKASIYVRAVHFSLPDIKAEFEDNYFDLLPNTERKIFIKSNLNASEFNSKLRIESLNETY